MVINLTPHDITLAPSPDPATWVTVPSSGRAIVPTTPGPAVAVEGCPVPVLGTPTYGQITGLPETAEPGTLLVVAFPVVSRALVERAELDGEKEVLLLAISERLAGENRREAEARITQIDQRLSVLSCIVGIGATIRWTAEDAMLDLCSASQVGQTRAATQLVRS